MSFLDPLFFFFIGPVLVAIALVRGKLRVFCLIVAAYVFYAASYPPYALILAAGTLFDYWAGQRIHAAESRFARNAWMAATAATNLGLLFGFKYLGFAVGQINGLLHAAGAETSLPAPHVALPLGISFFTFQSLSYTIDIYRRVIAPARSLLEFAAFISFFPHLVAGPIIRARDFLPQLEGLSPLKAAETWGGLGLILVGYLKKSVVGDNAGALVDPVFAAPDHYGGGAYWLASVFFAVQIYADFSGYTDIATGLSLLLGIHLKENFHWPYLSQSIRDFWRRWHMSLSFFLRDYLYHALGGDRRGPWRTVANLFVVWFLGGLWHGAAWHFVGWGLYHGMLVSAGRFLHQSPLGIVWRMLTAPGRVAVTFLLVTAGWVLFRAESLPGALRMWQGMASPWETNWLEGTELFLGLPCALVAVAAGAHVASFVAFKDEPKRTALLWLPDWARAAAVALAAALIIVFAGEARRFIYFDF